MDLQVVIVYVYTLSCTRLVGERDRLEIRGRGCNIRFPECALFGVKIHFETRDSVRCSEFRGGRFSEVAIVLQVWDFHSVTRTLSALVGGRHFFHRVSCPMTSHTCTLTRDVIA